MLACSMAILPTISVYAEEVASQGIEEEEPLAVTETLAEEAVAEVEETAAEAETPSEQPAEAAAVEEPEATVEELPTEVPADEAEEVPSEAAEPEADPEAEEAAEPEADPEAEEAAPEITEPETADAEEVTEEENVLPAEALAPAADAADAEIETVPELNAVEGTEETVAEEDIGFKSYAAPPVILVSSITLSGKTTMKAGESDYPTVTIAPETATNKGVSWTSVNPNVATVSADGVVYAVTEGNTLIYATAVDGSGVFAYYALTVTPAYVDITRVSDISITGKAKMNVGETYAISYSVLPVTAVDKTLSWETSDPAIATVNAFGVVTAVGIGACTITGISNSSPTVMDSYLLTVEKIVPVQTINVTVKPTMSLGEVAYSSYEVLPADASFKEVTWSSSDSSIVTVNEYGVVTAVGGGFATITATSKSDSNVYGTYGITVVIVPVTWISIVGRTTILVDESAYLGYAVLPATASLTDVTWKSSNPEVATVDATGKITGVSAGVTTITAKATDGSEVEGSVALMVTKSQVLVESIKVSGQTTLKVSESFTAVAEVTPIYAYEKAVYWSSDNPAVATVDQNGVVKGIAEGTAVISAQATDGTLVKGSLEVKVMNSVKLVTNVIASGKSVLYPSAVDYPVYGILPTDADNQTVTWSTSDAKIAKVDPYYGTVTAVAAGTATITATANDGSGVSGSYTVTVKSSIVDVKKVAVYGTPSMGVGKTQNMSYEIWPANADILTVTWKSSNTSIAKVNEFGVVTALKTGIVAITATSTSNPDVSGSFIINVTNTNVPVSRVEVYGNPAMHVSDTQYLGYGILPANADNKSVKWSTSNPAIATVDETLGIVKALAVGKVVITATARDDSGEKASITIDVTSTSVPVTAISIYGQAAMNLNNTQYLAYEIWPVTAGNKQVSWSSSNPAVATVDETYGIVKAVKDGTTVITATAKDGSGVTATFSITVTNTLQKVTYVGVIGPSAMTISEVRPLAYEILPADAADKSVTWSSSNPSVAVVDPYTGVVTAKANGSVVITATANDGSGKSGTLALTVTSSKILATAIAVYGSGTLNVNQTEYLSYALWPSNVSDISVTYTSSNAAVASVTSNTGIVTGHMPGTAVITITANDGSGVSATYTVTVN